MREPKCYRCVGWETADAPPINARCAKGVVHVFPEPGCDQFDSEAGTDWQVAEESNL